MGVALLLLKDLQEAGLKPHPNYTALVLLYPKIIIGSSLTRMNLT